MNKLPKLDFRNPKVRNPVLVIVAGLIGFLLWYQQYLVPTQETLTDLTRKKKAKQDTLNVINALKPQLASLREELHMVQGKLDSLKSIFPDQKEVPKLMRELTGVARASGIRTTKFNPLTDVEREYYIENRYNVGVLGGYHELGNFFSFLANFPLIINLSAVSMQANSSFTGEPTGFGVAEQMKSLTATFEMTTFSSKK